MFGKLIALDFSFLVSATCAASVQPLHPQIVHGALRGLAMRDELQKLAQACLTLLPGVTFCKPAPAGEQTDSQPISFAQHYARLYRIGTGILGWPPDVVWLSTPAEIAEAYDGFRGMLDDEPAPSTFGHAKLDRQGLNKLRGKGRLR